MRFRKLKKKLADYGILWDGSVGKGSHGAFVGLSRVTRTREAYTLPKAQQDEVQISHNLSMPRARL